MGYPGSVPSVPLGLGRGPLPLGGARTAGALTSVRIGVPESLSAYERRWRMPGNSDGDIDPPWHCIYG